MGVWVMGAFVFVIWMVIVVARSNGLMAVATFFFWPISIFHLISNWGVPGSDIRVPFLLTVIATGMWLYSANQVVDEVSLQFTAEDIAQVRAENPAAADEIERRQLEALGIRVVAEPGQGGNSASGSEVSSSADLSSPQVDSPHIPARPYMRKVPIGELNMRRGEIRMAPAFSTLTVPEHFRYIPAEQLGLLSEGRKILVDSAVLGWVVHDRIDLSQKDFWFVEVRFESVGFLPAPLPPPAPVAPIPAEAPDASVPAVAATSLASTASVTAPEPDPYALTFDPERALATWSEASAPIASGRVDLCAARLLRHGTLVACVVDLDSQARELGLRAARLIASRTRIESGWNHADFAGGSAAQSFEQWLEARQPIVVRAEAERADAETVENH